MYIYIFIYVWYLKIYTYHTQVWLRRKAEWSSGQGSGCGLACYHLSYRQCIYIYTYINKSDATNHPQKRCIMVYLILLYCSWFHDVPRFPVSSHPAAIPPEVGWCEEPHPMDAEDESTWSLHSWAAAWVVHVEKHRSLRWWQGRSSDPCMWMDRWTYTWW